MTAISFAESEESGVGAPPDHFDARIREIYSYWDGKRGNGRPPFRSDLDPIVEIPRLLSSVWLLDVESPKIRFRYRLLGNDMVSAGALPKVGDYLDERPRAGNLDDTLKAFKKVCESETPFWRSGRPHLLHDRFVSSLQLISLPLYTDRQGEVSMLMNMTIYQWQSVDD
jgi:hypothetical protein